MVNKNKLLWVFKKSFQMWGGSLTSVLSSEPFVVIEDAASFIFNPGANFEMSRRVFCSTSETPKCSGKQMVGRPLQAPTFIFGGLLWLPLVVLLLEERDTFVLNEKVARTWYDSVNNFSLPSRSRLIYVIVEPRAGGWANRQWWLPGPLVGPQDMDF